MMIRCALPLAILAMALPLASPALADVEVTSQGPVVRLSVTEAVKGRPDLATISAGVTSNAPTAVEAMRMNAREMSRVIDQIKALGIDEDDIQTTGVNLSARYDYNSRIQKQEFRGYQASNRVSVILRNIDRTGPVLDALVAAGATDLSGPDFSIADNSAAQAQARKAAMERALSMARDYARWAGYSNVRLLEVSENAHVNRPMPLARMAEADLSTPIQPGLVATNVSLSVTYQMVQ